MAIVNFFFSFCVVASKLEHNSGIGMISYFLEKNDIMLPWPPFLLVESCWLEAAFFLGGRVSSSENDSQTGSSTVTRILSQWIHLSYL